MTLKIPTMTGQTVNVELYNIDGQRTMVVKGDGFTQTIGNIRSTDDAEDILMRHHKAVAVFGSDRVFIPIRTIPSNAEAKAFAQKFSLSIGDPPTLAERRQIAAATRAVQGHLAARGKAFSPGVADGLYGPKTKKAIDALEKADPTAHATLAAIAARAAKA